MSKNELVRPFAPDSTALKEWLRKSRNSTEKDLLKIKLAAAPDFWKPQYIKRVSAGNVVEFVELKYTPQEFDCVKVDRDHYIRPSEGSGELHEYCHTTNRGEAAALGGVRKTIEKIRRIINANCLEPDKLHWVTLTYAENMTDQLRLYKDFSAFWKRFKRFCVKSSLPCPEYIAVCEPQARGAWHLHCLFIWDRYRPFIENDILRSIWRQGFVNIKGVPEYCDNIGAYFSAYLADIPADEITSDSMYTHFDVLEKSYKDTDGRTVTKKIVKGGRLHMYPAGFNIFRCSRGVKRPDIVTLDYEQAKKEKASAGTETFSNAVALVSGGDSPKTKQIVYKVYYNRKRVKSQVLDGDRKD